MKRIFFIISIFFITYSSIFNHAKSETLKIDEITNKILSIYNFPFLTGNDYRDPNFPRLAHISFKENNTGKISMVYSDNGWAQNFEYKKNLGRILITLQSVYNSNKYYKYTLRFESNGIVIIEIINHPISFLKKFTTSYIDITKKLEEEQKQAELTKQKLEEEQKQAELAKQKLEEEQKQAEINQQKNLIFLIGFVVLIASIYFFYNLYKKKFIKKKKYLNFLYFYKKGNSEYKKYYLHSIFFIISLVSFIILLKKGPDFKQSMLFSTYLSVYFIFYFDYFFVENSLLKGLGLNNQNKDKTIKDN